MLYYILCSCISYCGQCLKGVAVNSNWDAAATCYSNFIFAGVFFVRHCIRKYHRPTMFSIFRRTTHSCGNGMWSTSNANFSRERQEGGGIFATSQVFYVAWTQRPLSLYYGDIAESRKSREIGASFSTPYTQYAGVIILSRLHNVGIVLNAEAALYVTVHYSAFNYRRACKRAYSSVHRMLCALSIFFIWFLFTIHGSNSRRRMIRRTS